MSVHKSLATKSKLTRSRNVLKRLERITKLKDAGKMDEKRSVFGLPKVRTFFKVAKTAKAKAPAAAPAAAAAAAEPAAPAAAAGAGAKGGAPGKGAPAKK
ncbi:MAG: small basic protein [Planctomycetota bacterium]